MFNLINLLIFYKRIDCELLETMYLISPIIGKMIIV